MSTEKVGVGYSHAKAILIGDHAVVYNQPAVAIPLLNMTVKATLLPSPVDQMVYLSGFSGSLNELGADLEGIRQLIVRLLGHFNMVNQPFSLTIESNVPQERGFGASAALATAITEAFFDYHHQSINAAELSVYTSISENIAHGSPSGIDAAAVSSKDPIWYENKTIETFQMNLSATLVLADTGVRGQTLRAIGIVRDLLETNHETSWAAINHLGEIAGEVRQDLYHNHPKHLGQLFTMAHHELQSLNVSHPKLDNLVNAALHSGALGAKLTGSGIGGAMFALAKDNNDAIQIANALSKAGAQNTWIQPL
ncbi:mevalonate kinase [Convivina intestini]|uniref:mevalonate kinase n=1 Tax=Convivina intestini TaxID=1505726 RepID=UPI00200BA5BF|nr:mevalonate kinase [Convivina intestini]CAH1854966.1 Galactokinase [Convivina intestini]